MAGHACNPKENAPDYCSHILIVYLWRSVVLDPSVGLFLNRNTQETNDMNKVLFADTAGSNFQKLYGQSHYALAALVPASLVSNSDSIPAKLADLGLAAAIPFHSHVAMNFGELG